MTENGLIARYRKKQQQKQTDGWERKFRKKNQGLKVYVRQQNEYKRRNTVKKLQRCDKLSSKNEKPVFNKCEITTC